MSALDEAVQFYLEQTGGLSENETAKQAESELKLMRKALKEISFLAKKSAVLKGYNENVYHRALLLLAEKASEGLGK